MSGIQSLFGQTVIYGLSSVIARVLNFLLVPLYTVLFIPSEYAIISEMYAYAALLMILGSFGIETAFFRFSEKTKESLKSVFGTSFWLLFINASVLFLLGGLFYKEIAVTIRHESNPEYVLYFLIIIALDLLTIIPFASLRHKNKAVKFATIKTINIITNITFNLFFLLLCPKLIKQGFLEPVIQKIYNPNITVGYVFISNLIASATTILILLPDIIKNIKKPDYGTLIKIFKYSWPILLAGIAFIINESADKILIKYLLPKGIAMRELGIYSACYKLSIFMTLFVQAYRFAAEPFFFNTLNGPNSKKIYALMLHAFVVVACFFFLLVTLYIDIIKLIIPNPLYHEGIVIVPIVLLANMFLGIYYNLSVWYKVTDQTKYAAIISGIGAISTITLNIMLIPAYGYIGAAWSTLFCYFIMTAISFYLGQEKYKINYNLKSILGCFFLTFAVFILSHFSQQSLYQNIQLDNTVLFLLYTIFTFWQIKKIFKDNSKNNIII